MTVFSDRPERTASQQALAGFIQGWDAFGFGEVPPNAALVLARAPSERDVVILELSAPRIGAGGRTVTFRAEPIAGSPTRALREFEHTVQVLVAVPSTARSVTGTAAVPAGATVTVEVQSTGKSFPVANGTLRIPLT